MKRGIKTFARALRDKDIEEAEDMLDGSIVQGNMEADKWKGYRNALKGMIEALDSGSDLTLPRQISDDSIGLEKIRKIKKEMEERSSQGFRPDYEIGYNSAWSDVLQVVIEDSEDN